MFGGRIGPMEIIIILVILLLVLGPKRLPELARSIGRGIKEFRGGLREAAQDFEQTPPAGASQSSSSLEGQGKD